MHASMFSPVLNVIMNSSAEFYGHGEGDLISSERVRKGFMEVGQRFEGQI